MIHSKVFALASEAILVVGPLIVWLGLYLAAASGSQLRPALPWIRAVRWFGWASGVVLFIGHWAYESIPRSFGLALLTFAIGLAMPEGWVKQRFAPDLIGPETSGEYWPSERQ